MNKNLPEVFVVWFIKGKTAMRFFKLVWYSPKNGNAWTKCLPNHFGGCFARFLTPMLNLGAQNAIFWHLKTGTFANSAPTICMIGRFCTSLQKIELPWDMVCKEGGTGATANPELWNGSVYLKHKYYDCKRINNIELSAAGAKCDIETCAWPCPAIPGPPQEGWLIF